MTARARSLLSPWAVVGLLWFAYLLNYVDRQMIFSMFPLLRREFQFTDVQLGLVGTVFLWVYSVCMLLSGWLADKVRRTILIPASIVLWSLATLGTGFASSVSDILVWRAAMGVSESLYMPAAVGLIASIHRAENRSKALALHACAQYAGIVSGGWYGGWVADNGRFQAGFAAMALVGMVWAAVLAVSLRRVPAAVPVGSGASAVGQGRFSRTKYACLSAAFFCLCVILWMFYAWFPTLLYERFGLTMAESGLAATVSLQVSSAIGVLAGGYAGDRLSHRIPFARGKIVSLGLLAASPLAFLTLSQTSVAMAQWMAAGFGFTSGIMVGNTFASVYDIVPSGKDGLAIGVLNMIGGLAGGAAMALAGAWKATIGITLLMQLAAAAAAVAAIVTGLAHLRGSDHTAGRRAGA